MSASVGVQLIEGPLERSTAATPPLGVGAWLVFDGVVRPEEDGRLLRALCYEAYEPMTTRELHRLAERTAERHGLLAVEVRHSVGVVAVGEVSFRLSVGGKHRAEAIAAADGFIAQMKRIVPLWKTPVFADHAGG